MASRLYDAVFDAVRDIPPGRVASYGQVAALVEGCGPRQVGYALHALPDAHDVPWHRVLNARGGISLPGEAGARQRRRLEAEGVAFDARGRVELGRFGWEP